MKRVYFARRSDGTGPIKIGVSAFLEDRMYQLGVDYRASFIVLASADGDCLTERNIHLKFAAHRAEVDSTKPGASEWFEPVPKLLAFIKKVREQGRIPLMKSEQRQWVFAERYLAGETLQQIADDYGLTRERVRQVLRRIGVPSLGHRPEHCRKAHELTFAERRAAKLYETGTAPKDILAQTGLTHTQLRTSVLRSGFALKPHGHWLKKPNDAEITAEVCRLYREGLPIKEIVAAIPDVRFAETIYRYLKKGGIEPRRRSTKKCALEARAHEIIAAYRGGATYAEVAERFGASAVGIGNLIRRHGANLTPAEARERLVERVRESNRRRAVQSRIAA